MKRDSDAENSIEKRLGGVPAGSDSSNEKKAIPASQEEDRNRRRENKSNTVRDVNRGRDLSQTIGSKAGGNG
ncbi:hypothetical protein DL767_006564 [Monosporascus sp. MG133]|nr:hypothetical protein DL767_006564 [Monosporascus sp. MG133]